MTGEAFDVAVVGAGPAGSATARRLAQEGWRVALLERSRFEAARIGESLAPDVQGAVRELGLWSEFLALRPLPSWGTRSVWGDAEQQSHSHLLSPYGCGWHVDRRAFDEMLARGAAAAGATLLQGVEVRHPSYDDGRWRLRTAPAPPEDADDAEPGHLSARVLVDATGRRARVASSLGARRMRFDRLVGVAVAWAGVDPAEQGHLLVEAATDGWWYSAPLPGVAGQEPDRTIAMLMTDSDVCRRQRLSAPERWHARVEASPATWRRLRGAYPDSPPKVHDAHSQRLRRDDVGDATGAGPWLAVGDAALAVDPISGSGVLRALRTGRAAAATVAEVLARPDSWERAVAAYESDRDEECTTYLFERAQYYAAEGRFDSPFWERRQVLRRLEAAGVATSPSAPG